MSTCTGKTILLTGGCGYIGSQICCEIFKIEKEYLKSCQTSDQSRLSKIIIVDNLINSNTKSMHLLEKKFHREVKFYQIDIRDIISLQKVFVENSIDLVIHLAALKSVKQSILHPSEYYNNNVSGSENLLKCMKNADVRNMLFSSSSCVYGIDNDLPLTEKSQLGPINPYGQSKLLIERKMQQYIRDMELDLSIDYLGNYVALRYFNPIGADPSGLIGENPDGVPENLVPYLMKVITGELEILKVYGNDYPTPDGTAIRDYLHIVDLAQGHIKAMDYMIKNPSSGFEVFNLGTGKGSSVLDVIKAFQNCGIDCKYEFASRREGDAIASYANADLAKDVLQWEAKLNLTEMVRDALNFKKIDFSCEI